MTKKSIMMCMISLVMLNTPMNSNAQAAKVVTKIISKAASKVASKGGEKAASKAGATAGAAVVAKDANAVSRTSSTKVASEAEKTKTPRLVSYKCGKCDGSGKVSTWNSYLGLYESKKCSKCFGSGKVTRVIRY